MEDGIRSLLLGGVTGMILVLGSPVMAAEPEQGSANEEEQLKPVIQPEVDRREFKESRIDTENFEVTGFLGMMAIEDFGTNPVYGARLGYHITERLFAEGTIGRSKGGDTSYEVITGGAPLLTDSERELTYYDISLGYSVFPGEAFVTQKVTYNNDLFLVAGLGSTSFAGADRLTISYGLGYQVFFKDFLALRADFRDHMFTMDLIGESKLTHNLEMSLGLGFFF